MNTVLALGVLAVVAQAYSQCIPSCATGISPVCAPNCGCGAPAVYAAPAPVLAAPAPVLAAPTPVVAPTVIAPNSVAASLADTLSLLTVSSLLAETLPFGYPCAPPPVYAGCGYPQPYGYVL